jgi:hypothetical protein
MADADQVMAEPKPEEQVAEGATEAAAEGEDAPAAKKQRTAEHVQEADAEAPAAAEPSAPEAKPAAASGPKKIGYKTFQTGSDCYKYYHDLIVKLTKNQSLNEVGPAAAGCSSAGHAGSPSRRSGGCGGEVGLRPLGCAPLS